MTCQPKNNERFIVDRRGEPAVVIMSVQDFSTSRKTYQGAPSIGARVAERPNELRDHLEYLDSLRHAPGQLEGMQLGAKKAVILRNKRGPDVEPSTA